MTIDLDRWAVVAHNDDTGFGRMAADARSVLGVGWHFVVPSERLADKPLRGDRERLLPKDAPESLVRGLLRLVQGIIFFERPAWHPGLLRLCRDEGRKSVCVPTWEWFDGSDPRWRDCDFFACPTRFTTDWLRRFGFERARHVPWPLDLAQFPDRRISGPARTFIHNVGLMDIQDRKGTRDTLLAFGRVRRPDLRLIVRLQEPADLPGGDPRVEVRVGNLAKPAELYAEGEAAIQPSKLEGIGFMVAEPAASGLPVITLDHPPMNEFVTDPRMLVRRRWFRRRAFPTAWIPHAHLRLPSIRDLARRIAWCAEHPLDEISRANRNRAEADLDAGRLRSRWLAELSLIAR